MVSDSFALLLYIGLYLPLGSREAAPIGRNSLRLYVRLLVYPSGPANQVSGQASQDLGTASQASDTASKAWSLASCMDGHWTDKLPKLGLRHGERLLTV